MRVDMRATTVIPGKRVRLHVAPLPYARATPSATGASLSCARARRARTAPAHPTRRHTPLGPTRFRESARHTNTPSEAGTQGKAPSAVRSRVAARWHRSAARASSSCARARRACTAPTHPARRHAKSCIHISEWRALRSYARHGGPTTPLRSPRAAYPAPAAGGGATAATAEGRVRAAAWGVCSRGTRHATGARSRRLPAPRHRIASRARAREPVKRVGPHSRRARPTTSRKRCMQHTPRAPPHRIRTERCEDGYVALHQRAAPSWRPRSHWQVQEHRTGRFTTGVPAHRRRGKECAGRRGRFPSDAPRVSRTRPCSSSAIAH